MKRIYLDTASTTVLERKVFKAMKPYYFKVFGNPSSIHQDGVKASEALARARQEMATGLEAHADEIIFTSGGTEANNLALLGVAEAYETKTGEKGQIIISVIEHHSIKTTAQKLKTRGWEVVELPVNEFGQVSLPVLKESINPKTVCISLSYVNNEIGVTLDVKAVAKIIRDARQKNDQPNNSVAYPYFHLDACQATRFLPISLARFGVDLITINSSKIYGPKGVGALICRRGAILEPLFWGGGQERGYRSGTENVAGIIGFATALKLCVNKREGESLRLKNRRDYFWLNLQKIIPEVVMNGDPVNRIANNLNFSILGVDSESLVLALDAKGISVSSGSACASHLKNESHVLRAMNLNDEVVSSAIRVTLDRYTTKKQLNYFLKILPPLVKKLRESKLFSDQLARV